jgi:hypothetical protein
MADMGNIRETGQERIQAGGQKGQDVASQVTQKAKDFASGATERAQEFASTAGQKAEQGLASMGNRISSLAGSIRENVPHEGMIGSAAGAVAEGLETSGRYLQEHKLNDMVTDLGAVVRRYPIASLFVAFSVGCLIGLRRR